MTKSWLPGVLKIVYENIAENELENTFEKPSDEPYKEVLTISEPGKILLSREKDYTFSR